MASTVELDARILPCTHNNNPLPAELQPILDTQLKEARTCISACNDLISEIGTQILECQRRIKVLEKEIRALRVEMGCYQETRNGRNSTIRTLSNISLVRRLPPEVIASIIAFSVWSKFGHFHYLHLAFISRSCVESPGCGDTQRCRSHEDAINLFANTLNYWLFRAGDDGPIALEFGPGSMGLRARVRLRICDIIDWVWASNFRFVSLQFMGIFASINELQSLLSPSVTEAIDIGCTLPNLDRLTYTGGHYGQPLVGFIHTTLATVNLLEMELTAGDVVILIRGLPALQSVSFDICYSPTSEEEQDIEEEREPFWVALQQAQMSCP
ncbi:hypothetical protein BKA70DRAFT_1564257 [Coprinopsis sp. MPI-PUGE-AT-0042]|nr:hypothetical protein BKA70DRAFT_1564257 [Coprinopsis sp. MPI-PUGE-AT-0042]